MAKRETMIEWDEDVRSVWIALSPHDPRGSEYMADCFAAAATLIRKERLTVRGVQLADVPEGLILFCDKAEV